MGNDIANDGLVFTARIANVETLEIENQNISNLMGIEDFRSLKMLNFDDNTITTLDVSMLTKLESLTGKNNQLTYLNVKNGNNTKFTEFKSTGNENLQCISVDDVDYSVANWGDIDAQTIFSLNCSTLSFVSIPDANFEQYLIDEAIDSDNTINGQVLKSDIATITTIDAQGKNISDLTGIQEFTALISLNVNNNALTTINLTGNLQLEVVSINNNQLTTIDVSENTNLKNVYVAENDLTALDVTNNINLEILDVNFNAITAIDVSKNTQLLDINISGNQLSALSVTENRLLERLDCNFNLIPSLDVAANINLEYINCQQNKLQHLDLSQNAELTTIFCNDNLLETLNVQNGNNSTITNANFSAFANYNLGCIQVDNEIYSNTNWSQIDMQTIFRYNCNLSDLEFSVPDANFEQALIDEGIDSDGIINETVLKADVEQLTYLYLAYSEIEDATGIENFIALTLLTLSDNEISKINLSKNGNLEKVYLERNQLTNIDLSENVNLKELFLNENQLTNIDISENVNLEVLDLSKNLLMDLDVSKNVKLKDLSVNDNQLTSIDISQKVNLENLEINSNQLSTIDVSQNNNLTTLSIVDNNLTTINLQNNIKLNTLYIGSNSIMELDLSKNTNLVDVSISEKLLTALDLTKNIKLNSLGIGFVELSEIDLSLNTALNRLSITYSNISSINLSENIQLRELGLFYNLIETIDVSKNTLLERLYIDHNNLLRNLDLTSNVALAHISLQDNQLVDLKLPNSENLRSINVTNNLLQNIDISNLTNLSDLTCRNNQIVHINTFSNLKLSYLQVSDNLIEYLDLRLNEKLSVCNLKNNNLHNLNLKNQNNTKFTVFDVRGNPNLTCIEVDDVSYSETNWMDDKDNFASFSLDCSPANDECIDAIPLVFGQLTPGDIISGTSNNSPSCAVGTVLADVWYSIVVPQSGEFKLEGSAIGGQLKFAVFESCTSTAPIACGENISLTNLIAGTKYLVKVWIDQGNNSARSTKEETGTFTFKAEETSVLSTDTFSLNKFNVSVFPNPSSSSKVITLESNTSISKIELYTANGQKIMSKNINNLLKTDFDISKISTGIYFLKIKIENQIVLKKLLVN
ncbi:T9SS type A sorting domain-containing protein [Polaribacter sp.]|uniref:T9SS type A sorting domain-containing protein n=1 Tax=Polaribacter sp. TaxID=1920175 RepID=UPI003EF89BC9